MSVTTDNSTVNSKSHRNYNILQSREILSCAGFLLITICVTFEYSFWLKVWVRVGCIK